MHKKSLQFTATTIQEINEISGSEKMCFCQVCKTFCYDNEFENDQSTCIFCLKKIKQFKKISVFTFKPCLYLFYKQGVSKADIEQVEYEQMIFGVKTNFFEYNSSNLVWYIYGDSKPIIIYEKFTELFDHYKRFFMLTKNCLKNTSDKFKNMFMKNQSYISVNPVVSDFNVEQLKFSSFLPRERLFI